MRAKRTFLVWAFIFGAAGCASSGSQPQEPQYNIIRGNEQAPATGGIPPDKEAEIKLLLQSRETSTRKCYQDVLNEKHDRAFQGSVKLIIALNTGGQATQVKVAGGTLKNSEVEGCLVDTIKQFEFPQLASGGEVQYEYLFRPAY
jgi:hypothetical protein